MQSTPEAAARSTPARRDREAFAQAERLAHFARSTFNASPLTVLDVLQRWRDRYDVALTDDALTIVTEHVCGAQCVVREAA